MDKEIQKIIEEIKSIDVSTNVKISSHEGPCRYRLGESYEVRSAKAEKILESIAGRK